MNSCPVLQEAAWQRSRWPLTAAGWCTASAAWRSPPPLCHDTSSSTGWVAGTRGKREGAQNVLQCYKWGYQSHWGSPHIFNLVVYLTRTRRWERSKTRRHCSLSSWKKSGVGSGRRRADVTKCCDCSESVRSNPSSETRLMYQICLAVANQPTNGQLDRSSLRHHVFPFELSPLNVWERQRVIKIT